jgi:pimeloyl-ACP methyl ester carboxylesterase
MSDRSAAPPSQAVADQPVLTDQRVLSIHSGDGVTLAGEESGAGPAIGGRRAARGAGSVAAQSRPSRANPVVLLHGLSATRRYVVMGSRLLERSGYRVIAYDARGHGRSTPAPQPRAYGYERLTGDLLAVLDALEIERAVLAGASMGAHTLVRLALEHPTRVAALALITPSYDPQAHVDQQRAYAGWDALARGLRESGVEGFLAAYDFTGVPQKWRSTVETVVRQRLSAHEHPLAVADALEAVPRSRPFEQLEQLSTISVPTLVIASRDEADPGHPLAIGERYAQLIPGAQLLVEDPGSSPLAWQGGQLSKALLGLAARVYP